MGNPNLIYHFQVQGRGNAQAEIRRGSLNIPLKKGDFYFPAGNYILMKHEVEGYTCLTVIPKEVWERELPYMKNTSQELISAEEKTPVNLETIIRDRKLKIYGIPSADLESVGLKDKSKVVITKLSGFFSLWNPEEYKKFRLDAEKKIVGVMSELGL